MTTDTWTIVTSSGSWTADALPVSTLITESGAPLLTEDGSEMLADGTGVTWSEQSVGSTTWVTV